MNVATEFQDPLIGQAAWPTQIYNEFNNDFSKYHQGVDWSTAEGNGELALNVPVKAAANGKVVYAQHAGATWGNVVIVQHTLADNTVVSTLYGHLKVIDPEASETKDVAIGQLIGTIGNADGLYAAHLHFEIYLGELRQPGRGYSIDLDPNPSSDGWVDPISFIRNFVSPAADSPRASVSDASVTEGSNLKFTVTLDKPATAATKVYYETQLGSGATGAGKLDFAGKSGFVEIAAGKTTGTFAIGTVADKLAESSETMTVVLKSATEGVTIADEIGVGTIRDDGKGVAIPPSASVSDTSVTEGSNLKFTVTLDKPATVATKVYYETQLGSGSTGAGKLDFAGKSGFVEIAAGKTTGTFAIGTVADKLAESTETMTVVLKSAAGGVTIADGSGVGTIRDDGKGVAARASVSDASTTEGSNLKFTVTLDKPATAATKVYYETQLGSGATGAGKLDFAGKSGFVEIAAGKTTGIFAIGTVADKLAESTETMTVVLKSATGGVTIADGSGVGTIRDDGKGVAARASVSDASTTEGSNLKFTVTLDKPAMAATKVYYETQLGSGATGAGKLDFAGKSGFVEIAAGKTTGTFAIGTVADKLAESTETMTVVLKSATGGVTIADGSGVGTIRDDGKGGGKPDLVIQNAEISDTTLKGGDNVRLDWEIKNQGTGQAGSSDVGIYLSTDSTITTSDTRLDTNSTTALATGETDRDESDSFDLPSNLAAGTYYLGILADYQKAVEESNEGNNALAFQIIVAGRGKPDLVVENARISDTTLRAGENVRLDWEIRNQDTGQAGSSDVGIYLSKDRTITTSDTRLDTNSTTALAGGATDTNESDSFNLPSNLAPGTYYIGILADYQRVVDESNESNNSAYFGILVA